LLSAFSFNLEKISRRPFLNLLCAPQGRHSLGVICEPWSESPDSELACRRFDIAVSLLEATGIDLTRVLGTGTINRRPVGEDQAVRGTAQVAPRVFMSAGE
jgi:hypothetical protein